MNTGERLDNRNGYWYNGDSFSEIRNFPSKSGTIPTLFFTIEYWKKHGEIRYSCPHFDLNFPSMTTNALEFSPPNPFQPNPVNGFRDFRRKFLDGKNGHFFTFFGSKTKGHPPGPYILLLFHLTY